MNDLKLKRCLFIAVTLSLLTDFVAAPAGAWELNGLLKGKYAWNSSSTCVSATQGFGLTSPPSFPPSVPVFRKTISADTSPSASPPACGITYNYAIQGELSFDGRGSFDFKGGGMALMLEPYRDPPQGNETNTYSNYKFPINLFPKMEGMGTYAVVKEENELVVKITFTKTEVLGTPVWFENATDQAINLEGRIDIIAGPSPVLLSNVNPVIEDVHGFALPIQRICNATGSMVKLSPRRNWLSEKETEMQGRRLK